MNENELMELAVKGLLSEMKPEQQEKVKAIMVKMDEIFQPLYDGDKDEVLIMAAVLFASKIEKLK